MQDVTSDLQIKNPQVHVEIDRDKAAALGVTAEQIEDALYNAYGSRQVSTIYAPNNQYQVILELLPRVPARPGGALAALRPLGERASWCRSTPWPRSSRDRRAAHGQPPRASCRR